MSYFLKDKCIISKIHVVNLTRIYLKSSLIITKMIISIMMMIMMIVTTTMKMMIVESNNNINTAYQTYLKIISGINSHHISLLNLVFATNNNKKSAHNSLINNFTNKVNTLTMRLTTLTQISTSIKTCQAQKLVDLIKIRIVPLILKSPSLKIIKSVTTLSTTCKNKSFGFISRY